MSECQKCGACCHKLIIEIGCHDIVREPRLAAVARPFREVEGPCGFVAGGEDDGETIHDQPCHLLTAGQRCPMLGDDNLCAIYLTRPNVCVGFPAGGTQCQATREIIQRTSPPSPNPGGLCSRRWPMRPSIKSRHEIPRRQKRFRHLSADHQPDSAA